MRTTGVVDAPEVITWFKRPGWDDPYTRAQIRRGQKDDRPKPKWHAAVAVADERTEYVYRGEAGSYVSKRTMTAACGYEYAYRPVTDEIALREVVKTTSIRCSKCDVALARKEA